MYLEQYYVGRVAVTYEDAATDGVMERYASLLGSVPSDQLIFPILAVNDRLVAMGELDVYLILQAVHEGLEASSQPRQVMG